MVKTKLLTIAQLAPTLALLACAAPKAIVVQPPTTAKPDQAADQTKTANSGGPAAPNDGIRLPDMLAMPGDGEFRATSPTATKGGPEAGAVISRPPTDPPSRPKPKAPAGE